LDRAVECYNKMIYLSLDTCPAEAYAKGKKTESLKGGTMKQNQRDNIKSGYHKL